jgi:putative MATE family efflux protein
MQKFCHTVKQEVRILSKERTIEMTKGNPTKLLIAFAIPMLIGSIFQSLYNTVDSAVLGRFVGAEALAGIGATASTTFLMLSLAMGVTGAVSIVMSQFFGAKNEPMVKKATVSAIYLTLAAGIFMGIVGLAAARPIMVLLGTPSNIIDMSVIYIQITCGLCIAQFSYNTAASILRALGDSKTPLYFLILCSLLNIVLDLFFVLVLHMTVDGVAYATVISQALSAAACILFMYKKYPILRFDRDDLQPDWKIIRKVIGLGLPMALQTCLLSVGMMVMTRVINGFGSDIVAAHTIGSRIEQLATLIFSQVAFSFSVYSGQNFGAKDLSRIKAGFRSAFYIVGSLSLISAAVCLIFNNRLILLFVNPEEATIIKSTREFLYVQSLFFPALGWIWLYNSALKGIGNVRTTLISSVVELGSKISLSILLSKAFGYIGIWYAAPIGWVLGIIPSAWSFHKGAWKKKLTKEENDSGCSLNPANNNLAPET